MSEEIIMVCLICAKDIATASDIAHHAVIWETTGNYGSTVFDQVDGSAFLMTYVCDDCMEERQDRIVTVIKSLPEQRPNHVYKKGIHHDVAYYMPHQEANEIARAIAALDKCPLCFQQGRHRNACKMKHITEFFDDIDRCDKNK